MNIRLWGWFVILAALVWPGWSVGALAVEGSEGVPVGADALPVEPGIAAAAGAGLTWLATRIIEARAKKKGKPPSPATLHSASIAVAVATGFLSAWALPGVGAKEAGVSVLLGWLGSQGLHNTLKTYAPRMTGTVRGL